MVQYDRLKHDIYPGHALVIAICIMQRYPSLEAASEPSRGRPSGDDGKQEVFSHPAALGDGEIPGGGGPVYSALHILHMDDEDMAIAHAQYCWEGECSGAYKDRYEQGVQVAKELEPLFRVLWATWKGAGK